MAPAAYWASWADALQMVDQRLPEVANRVVNRLADEEPAGCLGELRGAASQLDRHGFVGRPDWHTLRSGARPEASPNAEPAEWPHGWETGGRWSEEAVQFVESLAVYRAREAPPTLQHSAALAWRRRWTRILSVSCARSFACSLVVPPKVPHALAGADGPLFEAQVTL